MSLTRDLRERALPVPPVQSDELWKLLTERANAALAAGRLEFARSIYEAALSEAVRVFEQPLRGTPADARQLAPMLHNISCHNLAELCSRSGDEDGARLYRERAFERLVETAASAQAPLELRKSCARHLRVATVALTEYLWERGLSHVAEGYVQRANAAVFTVSQEARLQQASQPA